MKKTAIFLVLSIIVVSAGCNKHISLKKTVPVRLNIVDMDGPAPAEDEADIIITTHLKKMSYLFNPRTSETPYCFTLFINGQELKESVKGEKEIESDMEAERGKGIHYVLKKRLRLEPGRYKIVLNPEDSKAAKVEINLTGGRVHTLKFDPSYGFSNNKLRLGKSFRHHVRDYNVYLDGIKVLGGDPH